MTVIVTQQVGAEVEADYVERLERLDDVEDVDVRLLRKHTTQQDTPGVESIAIVTFETDAAYAKWRTSGAGALGKGVRVRTASVIRQEGGKAEAGRGVPVVSFYQPLVRPAQYAAYTTRYIAPNMNDQRAAGLMAGYTMYLDREEGGSDPALSMLLMEYVSDAAYAGREPIKEQQKAKRLIENAEWKRINDTKSTIRRDIAETATREVDL
ncbi:hypothetical protein D1610_06910 [Sphingomonas gilva]|uniref:ABM domain-containing protein n=1 Tax=Sphingomonas gilva TaxID=2305907 RepID=A0A396RNW6_9SPHN|nr:hypothetical protein D1610_06910 [Sphingomonas gilva]